MGTGQGDTELWGRQNPVEKRLLGILPWWRNAEQNRSLDWTDLPRLPTKCGWYRLNPVEKRLLRIHNPVAR